MLHSNNSIKSQAPGGCLKVTARQHTTVRSNPAHGSLESGRSNPMPQKPRSHATRQRGARSPACAMHGPAKTTPFTQKHLT